jgi:uncharacterized protein (DUF302 family)
MAPPASNGVASIRSPHAFADTVRRLLDAFAGHGLKVFGTIDQQREAAAFGLPMTAATLILFGNPKAGTQLMLIQPISAIDLPLKVLVTEATPGEVVVSFNTTEYIVRRHSLPEASRDILGPAESLIASAIAQ